MATAHTAAPSGAESAKRGKAARWLMAGCLLVGSAAAARAGAPPVATMLRYHPTQDGIVYTIPKAEEEAGCKVELVKGPNGKGSGWALRDAAGKTLRVFFDTNDDNKIDVWSYYKDGVEVYREFESEGKTYLGKPDQFRWLNGGGMKWGVDEAKEGKVKYWKAISAEEVSQEVLQALATKDFARLQTLMITEAEMKMLELPADHVARIREAQKAAQAKFQKAVQDLPKLTAKATWVHLETPPPQCIPAEASGPRMDVLRYASASILYDNAGVSDYVQIGEMIQVGSAWRLVGAPRAGSAVEESGAPGIGAGGDYSPEVLKLIEELTELDKHTPDPAATGPNPLLARHHLLRTDLVEKIAAKVKPEDQEPWLRQMADSLGTAAQVSPATDTTAYDRLMKLEARVAQAQPGSNVAAYITYREMQADYAMKLSKNAPADFKKVQEGWHDRLAKFVEAYPKGEDTPDALLQLGMVSEFLDKDAEAKNWYALLKKNFPDKPQGAKGGGAIKRLELEGQPLRLAGPTLQDPNIVFDVEQMSGKVVIVYYWASWNSQSGNDFTKLKALLDAEAGKGVELVCVNLDNTAKEARDFLSHSPAPGTHLYQTGGLDSKLAVDYGVMGLPNLFLVGKDGKVVSRNVQINNLEDEVKKLVK